MKTFCKTESNFDNRGSSKTQTVSVNQNLAAFKNVWQKYNTEIFKKYIAINL